MRLLLLRQLSCCLTTCSPMLGSLPDLDFMANCIIMKQAVPQLLDIWIRTLLDALHAIRVNKLKSFCGGYDRLSK